MSFGVYTSVIREIALRLDSNFNQLGLKSLQIMHKAERLQPDMTPYIIIAPDSNFITESYGASIQQNRKDASVNISLWCEYPIDDRDKDNSLFPSGRVRDNNYSYIIDNSGVFLSDDSTGGFLSWLEQLLDVVNTKIQDTTIDPQLYDYATRSIEISVNNIVKHELTIECEVFLSIKTQPFLINNRQNL